MPAGIQNATYLQALLKDFGFPMKNPKSKSKEDNQSSIKVYHKHVMHKRSKHVDRKLHFIRDSLENKDAKIHCFRTGEMTTDLLTKSLPPVKMGSHRINIVLVSKTRWAEQLRIFQYTLPLPKLTF